MRWNLPPGQMPEQWFNVVPQLPEPLQPDLHPGRASRSAPTISPRSSRWRSSARR